MLFFGLDCDFKCKVKGLLFAAHYKNTDTGLSLPKKFGLACPRFSLNMMEHSLAVNSPQDTAIAQNKDPEVLGEDIWPDVTTTLI